MRILLTACVILASLLLVCCNNVPQTTELPTPITEVITPIPTAPPKSQTPEATTPSVTPVPSVTPTETNGFVPDKNTYGPYVFGQYEYYLYIEATAPGSEIALIDAKTGNKTFSAKHKGILNMPMAKLTASIMDLNFDNIPDFSFIKNEKGQRECWIASGTIDQNGDIQIKSYSYHSTLSSIPYLTRCFETQTLYGFDYSGTSAMIGYKYQTNTTNLYKSEELSQIFEWNINKVAEALAGKGASILQTDDIIIRDTRCNTYSVAEYLTIAKDEYGNFYLKDMPVDGFYRISLNPNGSWSKSEKVTSGN
jgi:hypothetical protein